jgi:hypothetical protein
MSFLQNYINQEFRTVYRFIFTKGNLGLIWAFDPKMNCLDLIKMKGYLSYNLERSSPIKRLGQLLLYSMLPARAEAGERHGTPNSNPSLPTRSGRCKEPILLTCDGEHGSRRASGDGVVRPDFYGGRISSRWCSGSQDVRQNFLELPSSFSTDQLL